MILTSNLGKHLISIYWQLTTRTDPKVLHTQSATEYWQRRGSLVHTDTRGGDLPQPDNVRVYLWSSSQHFAAPLRDAPSTAGDPCPRLP